MSNEKYPMGAIVFIILQIFFATRTVFGEYLSRIFPSFFNSWGIFGHVTRLDQSGANENI